MPTLSQQVRVDQSELAPRCDADPKIKKWRARIAKWREGERQRTLGMEAEIKAKWGEVRHLSEDLIKAEDSVVRIAEHRRRARREIKALNRKKRYRRGPCTTYEARIARRMTVIRNKIIEEKLLASKLEFQKTWRIKPTYPEPVAADPSASADSVDDS